MRRVFILMSSKALPYARHCIRTMLANCTEPVRLTLVADDAEEARILEAETAPYATGGAEIAVVPEEAVAQAISDRFPGLAGLRALHDGHPCWRKIIDPLALSAPEDEIIIADPDLFFPNRFDFEPTPESGVMMMRQGPNCLLPPDAVRTAFDRGLELADHVDIGVAQLRAGAVDPDWLDRAVTPLAVPRFRPYMHIEAIVWSAMAMRIGGRHLAPAAWRCWERGKLKRLAVAAGLPGRLTLRLEPLASVKCIHVSGPSKWWVTEGLERGTLREVGRDVTGPTRGPDYAELTRRGYERELKLKAAVRRILPAG